MFSTRDVVEINYLADDMVPLLAANKHLRFFVTQYFGGGFIFKHLAAFLLRLTLHLRHVPIEAITLNHASQSVASNLLGSRDTWGMCGQLQDIRVCDESSYPPPICCQNSRDNT
jgi:hypothetical protein